MHPGAQWSRPIQRVESNEMVELFGSEVPHERPHRATFELEHTYRVAGLQHLVDDRIVKSDVVDVDAFAGVLVDELYGSLDRCQVP